MKQFTRSLSLVTTAVFAVTILGVAPAFALSTPEDTEGNTSNTGSSTNMGTSESKSERAVDTTNARQKAEDFKKKAQEQLDQKRKEVKGKTAEQRKKVCEERSTGINKRFTNFGTNADKHLARIDDAYTKITAYQTTNQLDVANYDALVAAADAKQQVATDAVAALKLVNSTIDCSSADPAAAIAEVKTAVRTTHDTLKDYRTSVKDILSALRAAKENQ